MSISVDAFIKLHPKLYHMAEAGSWESIQQHGLLSTEALLDLFEIKGNERKAILECHRPECIILSHPIHGEAVIRDQKPMSDSALQKCLLDNLTPSDWYKKLNGKTFFWTTKKRLLKLLGARAYRGSEHNVLTVDSAEMFKRHADNITLSPYNSGSTIMKPAKRGHRTFLPLAKFPYSTWRNMGRGKDGAIVELVVEYGVPDIADFTDRVELMHGAAVTTAIYQKRNAHSLVLT